jgi:hypothetical protein
MARQVPDSERFGAIFADPAGVGKTAMVWMLLTLLKIRKKISTKCPVLLIAPGNNGNVREQWWDEYLLVQPPKNEKGEKVKGELNICWVDTELCGKKPCISFLDKTSPHGCSDVCEFNLPSPRPSPHMNCVLSATLGACVHILNSTATAS